MSGVMQLRHIYVNISDGCLILCLPVIKAQDFQKLKNVLRNMKSIQIITIFIEIPFLGNQLLYVFMRCLIGILSSFLLYPWFSYFNTLIQFHCDVCNAINSSPHMLDLKGMSYKHWKTTFPETSAQHKPGSLTDMDWRLISIVWMCCLETQLNKIS